LAKKEKGMSDLKKMGCKVARNEKNPDQGDDEDALHPIQQQQNLHPKKKKKWGGKKCCLISQKSRCKTQNDKCALETRKREEEKLMWSRRHRRPR